MGVWAQRARFAKSAHADRWQYMTAGANMAGYLEEGFAYVSSSNGGLNFNMEDEF